MFTVCETCFRAYISQMRMSASVATIDTAPEPVAIIDTVREPSNVHDILESLGLPAYLLPPDPATTFTLKRDDERGIVEAEVFLPRQYSRKIEIWSVVWGRRIRAVLQNGRVLELSGVSAGANIFKGVKLRVGKISWNTKNGGLDFLAVPPGFMPSFVVNLCSSHFDNDKAWSN